MFPAEQVGGCPNRSSHLSLPRKLRFPYEQKWRQRLGAESLVFVRGLSVSFEVLVAVFGCVLLRVSNDQ
jgi:hypothetical protein